MEPTKQPYEEPRTEVLTITLSGFIAASMHAQRIQIDVDEYIDKGTVDIPFDEEW